MKLPKASTAPHKLQGRARIPPRPRIGTREGRVSKCESKIIKGRKACGDANVRTCQLTQQSPVRLPEQRDKKLEALKRHLPSAVHASGKRRVPLTPVAVGL